MDLTQFLKDLKEYQKQSKLNFQTVIDEVESLIEEIRQDHIQGDVDDQERND